MHTGGVLSLPEAIDPLVAKTPTNVLFASFCALVVELLIATASALPPFPAVAWALLFCEDRACAELPPVA